MSYVWIFGAGLAFLASCITNAGVNIQKYSFMRNQLSDMKKSYFRQPLYPLGLSMVIFGSLGDFAALALAAQSIVAPMASVTLVSNILFAHFVLKEHLYKRDIIATCCIIIGCTLSIVFGDHSDPKITISIINKLFGGIGFIIYAIVFFTLSILLYILIRYVQPIKQQLTQSIQHYHDAMSKNDDELALQLDANILHLTNRYKPYVKIHPFAYCSLSGICGGNSILFGKMVAECLKSTIEGMNQMLNGWFYLYLFAMFSFICMQLHFLALGLAIFDALYVVPVFQCFFIVVSTIGGAAFFLEFNEFDITQCIIFPLGILMTIVGVYMLSVRSSQQADDAEKSRCSEQTRHELVSRVSMARSRLRENSIHPTESVINIQLQSPIKSSKRRSKLLFSNDSSYNDRGQEITHTYNCIKNDNDINENSCNNNINNIDSTVVHSCTTNVIGLTRNYSEVTMLDISKLTRMQTDNIQDNNSNITNKNSSRPPRISNERLNRFHNLPLTTSLPITTTPRATLYQTISRQSISTTQTNGFINNNSVEPDTPLSPTPLLNQS